MSIANALIRYRRHLKRQNYSAHTIKNYLHTLQQFVLWVAVPVERVSAKQIASYIDWLLDRGLRAKTINCHLDSIRGFYQYLADEEGLSLPQPVKRGCALRLPQPLPRFLKDEEVSRLFERIRKPRDRALFMLMLRCGLRVEEVSALTVAAIDWKRRRLLVEQGKGKKGRVVYLSTDALEALRVYVAVRPPSKAKQLFVVEKGSCCGKGLSVRGIQKRMEYYARRSELQASCHCLRHTFATQLLNADADLVTIQELLGHSRIKTTERYCRVSNVKAERDYFKAIEVVLQRTCPRPKGGDGDQPLR